MQYTVQGNKCRLKPGSQYVARRRKACNAISCCYENCRAEILSDITGNRTHSSIACNHAAINQNLLQRDLVMYCEPGFSLTTIIRQTHVRNNVQETGNMTAWKQET